MHTDPHSSNPQTSHFLSVKLSFNSIHTSTAFSWESKISYVHNWSLRVSVVPEDRVRLCPLTGSFCDWFINTAPLYLHCKMYSHSSGSTHKNLISKSIINSSRGWKSSRTKHKNGITMTIKIHWERYWNWILTPWNAITLWRCPPLLYNNIKTEIGHLLFELRVKTQNWRLHLSKSKGCSRGNTPVWKKIIYQLIKLSGFTGSHLDIKKWMIQ